MSVRLAQPVFVASSPTTVGMDPESLLDAALFAGGVQTVLAITVGAVIGHSPSPAQLSPCRCCSARSVGMVSGGDQLDDSGNQPAGDGRVGDDNELVGGTVDLDQCVHGSGAVCWNLFGDNSLSREVAMLESLEHQVGLILDTWSARHGQHEATLAIRGKAVRDRRTELNHRQTGFEAEVRSLMDGAVARANRYLTGKPEKCRLSEVVGYLTGPLCLGGAACNPIAYELLVDRQAIGETLLIELTDDGMIEASLGPFRPTVHEAHTSRVGGACFRTRNPIPRHHPRDGQ